jgi:pyruvate-ferredoxin/flavodoxin oxidoreductase
LFRFDPRRAVNGDPPLHLDYGPPKARVADYMRNESRFRVIERTDPARFKQFLKTSEEAARQRYAVYQQLAGVTVPQVNVEMDDLPSAPELFVDE